MPLHCVFLSYVSRQLHILCCSAVSSPFSDTKSRPTSSLTPTRSKTANNSDSLALVSRFEGCLCFPHGICNFFFWKCYSFRDVTFCVSWPKLAVWGTIFLFHDSLITFLSTAEIWAEDAHKIQVWWEELYFHSGPRYQSDLCMSPLLGKLLCLNRQMSQASLYEASAALPSWTAWCVSHQVSQVLERGYKTGGRRMLCFKQLYV